MPTPYSKNPKKHPESQLQKIALSLKEFGWQQPIIVDKEDVIVVGHARWAAYERYKDEYGLPEPWVVTADLTEKQAKAYRLADNKLNESDWDMELAIEELKDLSEPMLELSGFEDIEYLGGDGMPADDDWASAFEKNTMPKELKGLKQVTFILHETQVRELLSKLKEIGNDKNEALYRAVMAYDCSPDN